LKIEFVSLRENIGGTAVVIGSLALKRIGAKSGGQPLEPALHPSLDQPERQMASRSRAQRRAARRRQ